MPAAGCEFEFEWRSGAAPDAFAGHFPGRPVVPGAYLLDGIIRQVEIRCGCQVVAVDHAKFSRPVAPSARLQVRVTLQSGRARFVARNAAATACTGTLSLGPA